MSVLRSKNIYVGLLSLVAFSLSMPTAVFNILFPLVAIYSLYHIRLEELKALLRHKLVVVLWASYVLLFLGLLNTEPVNLYEGLDLCVRRIFFVVAPLLFIRLEFSSYKIIAYGFILGVITGFIICLINVVLTPSVYGHLSQIFISNWYWSDILLEPIDKHRSYFTFYCVLAFFMAFQFLTSAKRMREKGVFAIALLASAGIILTLEARMFILIFPFLFLVFVIRKYKSIKWAIVAMSLVALIGVIFYFYHPARFHNIRLLRLEQATQVRVEINKNIWGIIRDNWAFGVGTGDFRQEILKAYRESDFTEGTTIKYNAHNQYFEEWARGGILAVICLVAILLISFKIAYSGFPEHLVFVICLSLFLIVESALNRQQGFSFVLFFLCLYNTLSLKSEPLGEGKDGGVKPKPGT